jgi:protein SCO1/2/putative membrane protein
MTASLRAGAATVDSFGPVADFTLTERSGRPLRLDDLKGKVWVADFVYTRCLQSCVHVTRAVQTLQGRLRGHKDVRLVTFTVDPEFDTPEVLSRYASEFAKADPERWLFLTGSRDTIYGLMQDSFKVSAKPTDPINRKGAYEVDHTSKLILVDQQGHMRGYFDALDPKDLDQLVAEIDKLDDCGCWPALNASLNGTSAVLLVLGYFTIKRRWIKTHKGFMLAALLVSAVFLGCYLYYHLAVRHGQPTYFRDRAPEAPDWMHGLYGMVLLSHTVLAVVTAPMALTVAYFGLRDRLSRHVKLARWTLPIWLYVSVTGVAVYWMLYRLYP